MKKLIKFEYRKLWNKVTIVAIVALCILSSLHTFVYLNIQQRTIDNKGEIVRGLGSDRALKKVSEDVEGIMNGEYFQSLLAAFEKSADKQYLDEHRGYLGTGGKTKFMYPNYCINYAYYGPYMSNGNDKIGLDYDFLDSEEQFYEKYKETVKEHILYLNQYTGLSKYTEKQIEIIDTKITDIKTPFYVAYCQGISNIMNWYNIEYPIFYVVLAFVLACTYAKDSPSGVSELTLSSAGGRKRDFKARRIAGNLFTVTAYLIFVAVLVIEHGAIASLHGWNASAQTYWFNCFYNINIGTGLVMKLVGGLLGALVFANVVMLLSVKLRNTKVTSVISLFFIFGLVKLSSTYSQIKLLYPIKFNSDAIVKDFVFVGEIMIPYYLLIIALTVIYITIIWLFMRNAHRKYYLN